MKRIYQQLILITVLLLLFNSVKSFGQAFEGIMTLKVTSPKESKTVMIIKDDRSIMDIDLDSNESIRRIADEGAETTVILRRKGDLKYGFRSHATTGFAGDIQDISAEVNKVDVIVTERTEAFGKYTCTLVMIESKDAMAEAWITGEIDMRLTRYFPSFLGSSTPDELYTLRQIANQEGFVMRYSENIKVSEEKSEFELDVDEREIPNELFIVDPAYDVFDENSLKQLYQEAQRDSTKQIQWEEFMQIFGKQ